MALLLWSGGCDSTALLCDLLKSRQTGQPGLFIDAPGKEPIRTIAVDHPQIGGNEYCKRARAALLPILRNRYGYKFEHGEVKIRNSGIYMQPSDQGLVQPQIWLSQACAYLTKNENLYVGYIKGDDIWHYQGWLFESFRSLQAMAYRTGELKIPLEWFNKPVIISYLKKEKVLNKTWSCQESPKNGKPCHKCASCVSHATALWYIQQGYNIVTT